MVLIKSASVYLVFLLVFIFLCILIVPVLSTIGIVSVCLGIFLIFVLMDFCTPVQEIKIYGKEKNNFILSYCDGTVKSIEKINIDGDPNTQSHWRDKENKEVFKITIKNNFKHYHFRKSPLSGHLKTENIVPVKSIKYIDFVNQFYNTNVQVICVDKVFNISYPNLHAFIKFFVKSMPHLLIERLFLSENVDQAKIINFVYSSGDVVMYIPCKCLIKIVEQQRLISGETIIAEY